MQNISLIDAHCHLDFAVFDDDRDHVIQRALTRGIESIIIPGTQRQYWDRVNKLCANNDHLYPCYGLHPYWVKLHKLQHITQLDNYIEDNQAVAIGECGLDFRTDQADRERQLLFFQAQLEIAHTRNLPVVIHSVRATEKVIDIIKQFDGLTGMIHSYSGSLEQARRLIDLGFYISLCGNVTFENASKIRKTAKHIPLTSLLLETDAPDQPAKEYYGQRNEPAYIINTLNTIAELRQISTEEIAAQTTTNAHRLFGI